MMTQRMDLKGKDSVQPSQYVRCCHMSLSMRLQLMLLLLLLTIMTPGQIAPVTKSGDIVHLVKSSEITHLIMPGEQCVLLREAY